MESVAESLVPLLITAIKDHLKYVWSYKRYIKDLSEGLTHLKDARERVQEDVNTAIYDGQTIHEDVSKWLEEAKTIIDEATKVMEMHKHAKKGCIRGVIPNPSTRFSIARLAEGNKQEIDKLKQRSNFPSVSHPHEPVGVVTGSHKGPDYWIAPSRASLLVDISKALLDDNIRTVGIWGASGVGKSIFLKQLEKQVQERKLNYDFDAVTMVTVSRSPNWEKIQDDLGYKLGLKIKEENTVAQKAIRLRERLSRKDKVLIILDDIWDKIDLEKLGIPFDNNHPKIKLLLTSRSEQVLRSKMDAKHNFHLKALTKCEAMDLFKQFLDNESTLIEQLAEECAGLPVLISTLAASLKSLPSFARVDALTKLKQSKSLGFEKFIDKSLEFSYHLTEGEEAKSLFLLCGQIGNQIISTCDILIYGMGLGILNGRHTIEEAREKVRVLLDSLKASCLLEEHGEGYIRLHDLMSDAALSIASKTQTSLVIRNSNWLTTYSDDDFKGCKSISLHLNDKMHELPERLMCPILDMLLIYATESTHLEIPNAFFIEMRELKVLDLSNLIITSLPSSISFLKKLHTLCLDHVIIEDLVMIGKLKTLRTLTLRSSNVSRLPKEIGGLNNLRLLDLTNCSYLEVIEPNVLGSLKQMEELHLPTSFDRWDAEGTSNASLTELNNMSRLSTLDICVPNAASLPNNMPFQQLIQYKIYIGNMWSQEDFGKARTLKLALEPKSSKTILKELLQTTLKKTQDLYLHGFTGFEESIVELSKEGFPELKHIHVEKCPSIQYIIHSKEPKALPVLESLFLCGLTNLREICKSDISLKFLTSLKAIKIEACDKLRNLFSLSLVNDLPNLEEIEVADCEMIQEIITYADDDEKGITDNDKFELLNLKYLRKLKLVNLPNISSFCSKGNKESVEDDGSSLFDFMDGRQVSFTCLESLILCELPKLTKVSHHQYPVQLHLLKSLELYRCEFLLYAINSNLLLQLRNLDSLIVDGCGTMNTVFNLENLDDACGFVLNKPLQIKLKLYGLPNLETLWKKNPKNISEVLEIQKLEVSNCGKLKNLFSSTMVKSLEKLSYISIASCMAMEEIILEDEDSNQESKDGMVFPSLNHLSIHNMESLKTFSHGNHHHKFPSLTLLMISSCPKMRTFVSTKLGNNETVTREDVAGDVSFFNSKVVLPNLEKLVLNSLKSMQSIWENNLSKDLFSKLAFMEIKECASVQSIFHSHFVDRLQNLTKVEVESCESLKVLFGYGHIMFSKLQEVRLIKLKKLRDLSEEPTMGFPSLREIFVQECDSLISLFSIATTRSLFELANVHISSCQCLKEVISSDGEEGNMALTEALKFSNLISLQLENLGSLVYFCLGHYELYFPFLRKLLIVGCENLKAFVQRSSNLVSSTTGAKIDFSPLFDEKVILPNLQELQLRGLTLKEIWPKNEHTMFEMNLKVFVVEHCRQLSIIAPSFMLHNFQSLESLHVKSCNSVEVIFKLEKCSLGKHKISSTSTTKILENMQELIVSSCNSVQHIMVMRDGDDHSGETYYKTVKFPQLSSLKLSDLPRFDSFCYKNHEIKLPSLKELKINDCQAAELLIASSNQHCKRLLSVEKVEFPRMESMEISSMQNVTELWHIGTHSDYSSEVFCKLKRLKVEKCDNLLTIFPYEIIKAFQSLEELSVEDCKSLESVFESPGLRSGAQSSNSNSNHLVQRTFDLRELFLSDLPRMKHVWNVEDPIWVDLSFEKLHTITILLCIFNQSIIVVGVVWEEEIAHNFLEGGRTLPESGNFSLGTHSLEWPSLKTLILQKCPNAKIFTSLQQKVHIPSLKRMFIDANTQDYQQFLNEIYANPTSLGLMYIENQEWVEGVPWLLLLDRFPNVESLEIRLSNYEEIFPLDDEKKGAESVILDIAKTILIAHCQWLTILPPYSARFHKLIELNVWDCNGLRYLVTSSVARGLVQLIRLEICRCNLLEEIVTYDCDESGNKAKDDDVADTISFPHLKQLRLYDLTILQSFSSTSCKFNFPSLGIVYMRNLPMMHAFCEGGFDTPYKHRITRNIRALYNLEFEWWEIRPSC